MERITARGREVSEDGGLSWSLVEPSEAWLAARAAEADPEPEPVVLPLAEEIAAARTLLLASSTNTVLLTKQRAAALDALREQQLLALVNPET